MHSDDEMILDFIETGCLLEECLSEEESCAEDDHQEEPNDSDTMLLDPEESHEVIVNFPSFDEFEDHSRGLIRSEPFENKSVSK
jgi:hypothetical protein